MEAHLIIDGELVAGLRTKLEPLYGERAGECLERILALVDAHEPCGPRARTSRWDETDAILITYADQVSTPGEAPLATLARFLSGNALQECISTVHLLPFFPFSSDDGFSVIDFRRVDPRVGDWDDVDSLGQRFGLMFDLVLNHVSSRSRWLEGYTKGESPYDGYVIEMPPDTDLSMVTRPRTSPLLTPFETSRGTRHLWTTFSADQVDLNYSNPEVLVEMIDVLLLYLRHGARIVRLDAVAFLWKTPGTTCLHLPETHLVVKILRQVMEHVSPDAVLLTETNVPHDENVSYFGEGDEAHMVYQFSLPPLLLDAYLHEDAGPLEDWLRNLSAPHPGTTYFNFTASHDGIGVRPLEGLVAPERMRSLLSRVEERGAMVSNKTNADGSVSPYELNITYVDALGDPNSPDPRLHARRFLASQAVMLSLQGIPGIYVNSLVGEGNDYDGVRSSGQARRINRHKHDLTTLESRIAQTDSLQALVFQGFRRLLSARRAQPALHPDATQRVLDTGDGAVLAFERARTGPDQRLLVVANTSGSQRTLTLADDAAGPWSEDLLDSAAPPMKAQVPLQPYQVRWLRAGPT